jgi:hypothetical protein
MVSFHIQAHSNAFLQILDYYSQSVEVDVFNLLAFIIRIPSEYNTPPDKLHVPVMRRNAIALRSRALELRHIYISYIYIFIRVKQSHYKPGQALRFPGGWDFKILRQSAHEYCKVVSLTHRPPLLPGNIPGTHFYKRLSWPQGHSTAGSFMSLKNSSDTIGNRTRDLPVCRAVPQSLRHLGPRYIYIYIYLFIYLFLTAVGLTPGSSGTVHGIQRKVHT